MSDEITQLQEELKVCRKARDDWKKKAKRWDKNASTWMNMCAEARKEVITLRHQLMDHEA